MQVILNKGYRRQTKISCTCTEHLHYFIMREITFDTETTGLDPKAGHRVIEIGCIELKDGIRTGEYFHAYINPEREVPRASTDVHGLTDEFLADKPKFAAIAASFLEFIGKDKLVIHNAAFDLKFINFELEQAGLKLINPARAIDTLNIARNKFPGAKASLDALCSRFNIDLSRREKHGALLDAELLADVYLELISESRQGKMLLDKEVISSNINEVARKFREMRLFEPSGDELAAHAEFVKGLKGNMW